MPRPDSPRTPFKGRGASQRNSNRFEQRAVVATAEEEQAMAEHAPATNLHAMTARSIISHNQSPDIPFDRSINPYLGCEHGCVYCYARPSHSYLDLSPGLDFETEIYYKTNAVERLLTEWEKPGYVCAPITIGANTDPYQPAENKLGITRKLLKTFLQHRHPVSLISKGVLMERDLDLLAGLAAQNLCSVAISIPTMDNRLKRLLEPRVPAARARLRLLGQLRDAGVPTTLLLAPVIPAVNDNEIESIIAAAADQGVQRAAWILLRLPQELGEIFRDWLQCHMPDRASHVMSLVQSAHGGRDYDARYGHRQTGKGAYADMIGQRFRAACQRHRLLTGERRDELECKLFRPPGPAQLGLPL